MNKVFVRLIACGMVYHFKEKKRCLKNQLWDNFYNFALKQLHECLLYRRMCSKHYQVLTFWAFTEV